MVWLAALTIAAAMLGAVATTAAARVIRYHGYRLTVPSEWPVFDLSTRPGTCVRFNRHAVYLGTPSEVQNCPAHAAGRTEAVLISPGAGHGQELGSARAAGGSGAAGIAGTGGSVDRVALGSSGLVATATWSRDRALVGRILGRGVAPTRVLHPALLSRRARSTGALAHAAEASYTGLGFDACSAPSTESMSAWSQSPFRAVGVYIGGVNAACSQTNLTPAWVTGEVQSGWHLIPTYVGYQGVGSCGGTCATISPSQATAQGTAAAEDAVSHAEALGIPAGNPIYDDMEQYSESSAHTAAVLAFLAAWTSELHAAGYLSGVYSSASSAITDLVKQQGTGYLEPDDIWVGDWNNKRTASDPYVPSADWSTGRIHQYDGAHNDTYGGVTLNVDSDYLDAATADTENTGSAIADGTFVRETGTAGVYRIAGDAPLYVSSWTAFGARQPATTITAAQFNALGAHPADGTFVQTTTGEVYRFAGGAPIAVSSWSVFGAAQPDVIIDQWDIDNAGSALSHVSRTPANGTVVEGLPSGMYWAFHGGLRSSSAPSATAVEVDDIGLGEFAQGTAPTTGTVTGAGAEQPLTKPVKQCVVPQLKHMTLNRAQTALKKADCTAGTVRRPKHIARHQTLHVFGQSAKVRSRHAARYRVNLWLT